MKNRNSGKRGFTLVEIMIVVAIVGLLAVIAVPSYVRARDNAQVSACLNNLRQIGDAKDIFAIENSRQTGDPVVNGDINPYLKQPMEAIKEPAGGDYTLEQIGIPPTCSIGGRHSL